MRAVTQEVAQLYSTVTGISCSFAIRPSPHRLVLRKLKRMNVDDSHLIQYRGVTDEQTDRRTTLSLQHSFILCIEFALDMFILFIYCK